MSNIVRTDPFQDFARIDPFRELAGWPRLKRWLNELPAEPAIRLDVTENDQCYHVKADLPGAKKEDIRVEIDGNQVSLSAEMKRETVEKKGEVVVHAERSYGQQFRSFVLEQPIDRDKAQATFKDGVLELTLPKNAAAAAKRLAIQ